MPIGGIVARGCTTALPPEVVAAYDAPFPEERYKAGARQFPLLVPTRPDARCLVKTDDVHRVVRLEGVPIAAHRKR